MTMIDLSSHTERLAALQPYLESGPIKRGGVREAVVEYRRFAERHFPGWTQAYANICEYYLLEAEIRAGIITTEQLAARDPFNENGGTA